MQFRDIDALIPWVKPGEPARMTPLYPQWDLTAHQPGRHAADTDPPGGDFRVDMGPWAPTHTEKFTLIEALAAQVPAPLDLARELFLVIHSEADPDRVGGTLAGPVPDSWTPAGYLPWTGILALFQCIAVAEDRRYPRRHVGGGRYLPFNFARLVAIGACSAEDVGRVVRTGTRGLRDLEIAATGVLTVDERWRLTNHGVDGELWGT
jgi:hypothetical protein